MFEGLFQPMHLIVILFIVLLIFGPGKLPEVGKGLGKAIREFKNAMAEGNKPAALENKPLNSTQAEELPTEKKTV